MAKTNKESSMEEQIKTLQRHFGGIISTVKDLKATVDALKKRSEQGKSGEVQEIVETQRVIDELVVANSDSIKQIKSEIIQLKRQECVEACVEGIVEGQNENKKKDNMNDIIAKQHMFEKTIVKNSEAIKVLDREIICILKDKNKKELERKEVDDAINKLNRNDDEIVSIDTIENQKKEKPLRNRKKCRYNNRGYCKYTNKCRFIHPVEICSVYLETQNCDNKECPYRHPQTCKWGKVSGGCKRHNCDYLHSVAGEVIIQDVTVHYKCEGCKHIWENEKHVVEHNILNMKVFFCLNCNDWIKDKLAVFNKGWTLFDKYGHLRHDV